MDQAVRRMEYFPWPFNFSKQASIFLLAGKLSAIATALWICAPVAAMAKVSAVFSTTVKPDSVARYTDETVLRKPMVYLHIWVRGNEFVAPEKP